MTPTMLRQLWSLIESTQSNILLKLDDTSLVQWLLRQCHDQQILNHQESDILGNYIQSKIPLIRDLAQQR
jgi:hypothetical protein